MYLEHILKNRRKYIKSFQMNRRCRVKMKCSLTIHIGRWVEPSVNSYFMHWLIPVGFHAS